MCCNASLKSTNFRLIERPEDPGIMNADKAPTIGNQANHCVADGFQRLLRDLQGNP